MLFRLQQSATARRQVHAQLHPLPPTLPRSPSSARAANGAHYVAETSQPAKVKQPGRRQSRGGDLLPQQACSLQDSRRAADPGSGSVIRGVGRGGEWGIQAEEATELHNTSCRKSKEASDRSCNTLSEFSVEGGRWSTMIHKLLWAYLPFFFSNSQMPLVSTTATTFNN